MSSKEHMIELAVTNLLSIFEERDKVKRLDAMKKAYDPSATLIDPSEIYVGYEAISGFVDKLLGGSPGMQFQHPGKAWVNHDLITMEWAFGPSGGDPVVKGNDIILVGSGGKIEKIWTMLAGVSEVEVKGG